MWAGQMRKHLVAGAAVLCMAAGGLTATAGGQTTDVPQPLERAGGVLPVGGQQAYDTVLEVNDLLTVWAANAGAPGGADLRVRLQRWGYSNQAAATATMVDVGSITVPPGSALRFDQVATATAPYQVVVDAPGATAEVPYSIDPVTTPGAGPAAEHTGRQRGAVSHIVGTAPNRTDVRYLSEPAAGLTRWRVDFAPGDEVAVSVDHLAFDRPEAPLVACLYDPNGTEVATVTVSGAGGGALRYTVPGQGHYLIDVGCRPGAPTSGLRPYFTPRRGRVPAATSLVGAPRLVAKAGTQNGGALDRFWRIDLEAGDTLDLWFAATDPETAQGTICIDGPPPTGGLTQVAALTVPRGQAGHVVLDAPWTGRYVINGACLPGDGLFEVFVN